MVEIRMETVLGHIGEEDRPMTGERSQEELRVTGEIWVARE